MTQLPGQERLCLPAGAEDGVNTLTPGPSRVMEVGPNGGKMGEPSRNFIAWLSQPLRLLLELFSLTFLSLDILF